MARRYGSGRSSDEQRSRLLGSEIAWTHREGTGVKFRVLDYVGLPLAIGRGHRQREAQDLAMEALERVGSRELRGAALGGALQLGAAAGRVRAGDRRIAEAAGGG